MEGGAWRGAAGGPIPVPRRPPFRSPGGPRRGTEIGPKSVPRRPPPGDRSVPFPNPRGTPWVGEWNGIGTDRSPAGDRSVPISFHSPTQGGTLRLGNGTDRSPGGGRRGTENQVKTTSFCPLLPRRILQLAGEGGVMLRVAYSIITTNTVSSSPSGRPPEGPASPWEERALFRAGRMAGSIGAPLARNDTVGGGRPLSGGGGGQPRGPQACQGVAPGDRKSIPRRSPAGGPKIGPPALPRRGTDQGR